MIASGRHCCLVSRCPNTEVPELHDEAPIGSQASGFGEHAMSLRIEPSSRNPRFNEIGSALVRALRAGHGVLRGAAAGGCPRGTLSTQQVTREGT